MNVLVSVTQRTHEGIKVTAEFPPDPAHQPTVTIKLANEIIVWLSVKEAAALRDSLDAVLKEVKP